MCLLTVAGCSMLTQQLGFSNTLGAFIAGVLLSETNYKAQVEADIKPFRGLLLGLFFVTTGSSINMSVLYHNWEVVAWILAGLLSVKTAVIASLGRGFGLSANESLRLGFLLSQGGEFAFVLLSLANTLHILPEDLNQVLIIVVVLSMALTPALAEGGKMLAEALDDFTAKMTPAGERAELEAASDVSGFDESKLAEPVVICGFGPQGQLLANMLEAPLAGGGSQPYIAFDLDPKRVQASRAAGFTTVYGDGSRPAVLKAAGVKKPKAVVVCLGEREMSLRAVQALRSAYPTVLLYACGMDLRHAAELEEAGADTVVVGSTESGLALGGQVLEGLGSVAGDDLAFLKAGISDAMVLRTHTLAQSIHTNAEAAAELDLLVLDEERHSASNNSLLKQLRRQRRRRRLNAAGSSLSSMDGEEPVRLAGPALQGAGVISMDDTTSLTASAFSQSSKAKKAAKAEAASATLEALQQREAATVAVIEAGKQEVGLAPSDSPVMAVACATLEECGDDPDVPCEVFDVAAMTVTEINTDSLPLPPVDLTDASDDLQTGVLGNGISQHANGNKPANVQVEPAYATTVVN